MAVNPTQAPYFPGVTGKVDPQVAELFRYTFDLIHSRLPVDGAAPAAAAATPAAAAAAGLAVVEITSANTPYPADPAQNTVILVDATGGAIQVDLPALADVPGRVYHVKKTDASANAVTVAGASGDTIDGAATAVILIQYESLMVVAGPSEWGIH